MKEKIDLTRMTDGYKLTHWKQYPKGTTTVLSYLESRGGKFPATVFFGLQYYLKKYLTQQVTMEQVIATDEFCKRYIETKNVFNREGWEYIVNEHNGYLPLEIKAVSEGVAVPTHNVLMTIQNTDDKCFWLTNYVETLLMKIWAPITIATNSFYCKKTIKESAIKTGSNISGINFKLHDFGYRGVSSEETSAILGAAHLINFMGTDTLSALTMIEDYYNWDSKDGLPGYSVVAAEHSTATPFGRNGERDFILNMLEQYPEGVISVIADSFNVFNFCTLIGTDEEIREKILNRNGCFVVRPDSGEPIEVVNKIMDILWSHFSGTFTDRHYKLLNEHIRVIQGDGIDYETIGGILNMLENSKYASDNIVFGSGGGLLQKFDRDTQKFAIKCCQCIINGKEVNVQKDPVTSSGKKSKQGRLKLHLSGGNFSTISSADQSPEIFNSYFDFLETVFLNGKIVKEYSFNEIRKNATL